MRGKVWKWIKSETEQDMNKNLEEMMESLLPAEREYVITNWVPKITQEIHVFTTRNFNLGAHSTQRTKGMHPAITAFTSPHHNLDQAIRLLIWYSDNLSDTIQYTEAQSRLRQHHPLHLDPAGTRAFQKLENQVTLYSLDLMKREWLLSLEASRHTELTDMTFTICTTCKTVTQFRLPCIISCFPMLSRGPLSH